MHQIPWYELVRMNSPTSSHVLPKSKCANRKILLVDWFLTLARHAFISHISNKIHVSHVHRCDCALVAAVCPHYLFAFISIIALCLYMLFVRRYQNRKSCEAEKNTHTHTPYMLCAVAKCHRKSIAVLLNVILWRHHLESIDTCSIENQLMPDVIQPSAHGSHSSVFCEWRCDFLCMKLMLADIACFSNTYRYLIKFIGNSAWTLEMIDKE